MNTLLPLPIGIPVSLTAAHQRLAQPFPHDGFSGGIVLGDDDRVSLMNNVIGRIRNGNAS